MQWKSNELFKLFWRPSCEIMIIQLYLDILKAEIIFIWNQTDFGAAVECLSVVVNHFFSKYSYYLWGNTFFVLQFVNFIPTIAPKKLEKRHANLMSKFVSSELNHPSHWIRDSKYRNFDLRSVNQQIPRFFFIFGRNLVSTKSSTPNIVLQNLRLQNLVHRNLKLQSTPEI